MNFSALLGLIFGSKQEKDLRKLQPIVDKVNTYTDSYSALSDEALKAKC